jgi:hypothetical protein
MQAYERHAHGMDAYAKHAMRDTPMRGTPMRCMSMRCTLIGRTPVGYMAARETRERGMSIAYTSLRPLLPPRGKSS